MSAFSFRQDLPLVVDRLTDTILAGAEHSQECDKLMPSTTTQTPIHIERKCQCGAVQLVVYQ